MKKSILHIILVLLFFTSCGILIKQPKVYHYEKVSENLLSGYFFSYSDGRQNFINPSIIPEAEYLLICIPGLGAHSGTYKYFQQFLYSKNISSVAIDLRGFGHWNGKKGDVTNIGVHIADLDEIVDFFLKKYPHQKILLVGESLGSSIAIWYNFLYPNKIFGVVATSVVTNNGENKVELKSVFNLLIAYSFYPQKPIYLGYNPTDYCNDSIFNKWAFEYDTLGTNSISTRYLIQANRVIKKSYKQICNSDNILMIQGGKDFLSELDEIKKVISTCKSNNIELKYYERNQHSVLNDTNRLEIYDDILKWLK